MPSPALVVAIIALIVAMGGTGYAAFKLPKNSVGTKQLKKNAVTGSKIKKNAVTSSKVKNGSLLSADFKAGQLPAGSQGPKGDQGPIGPSNAFEAFRDSGPANITSTSAASPTVVATLSGLPAGAYALSAKTVVDTVQASDILVHCRLTAEGDFDESTSWMGTATTGDVFRAAFPMQITHTFTGPGTATVSCYRSSATGTYSVQMTKITAIKLGSETHTAVTG